jgi:DNA-binding MarR family transcriptional regulator
MPTDTSLTSYIERVTGTRPQLEDVPKHETANVPLFLRERYQFSRAILYGRHLYFAIEKTKPGELSAPKYASEAELLKKRLSADVILIFDRLPSYVRNRFVKQGVPFIVPGTQMFLPTLMIDLREHFSKADMRVLEKLSPTSQVVVLYHILKAPLPPEPLAQLAKRLGYSAMAMSKAQEELVAAKLSKVERAGRTILLRFELRGRDLWQKAEPLLATPVKRTYWVRWGQPRPRAVIAGVSALTQVSMLTDDQLPTYAMRDKDVVSALGKGYIVPCDGREEAQARMEAWKYDPWLLTENETADRCSLYLSLRNNADERIQKELQFLVEGLPQ